MSAEHLDQPANQPLRPPALRPLPPTFTKRLNQAVDHFSAHLETGSPVTIRLLQETMHNLFDSCPHPDARQIPLPWEWHHATDAVEAAIAALILRHAAAFASHTPFARAAMLQALARLEPSHRVRSLEQQRLQQFSTPWPLAGALIEACAPRPDDHLLEPSAGTGVLAALARPFLTHSRTLYLNEISPARHALLAHLLPAANLSAHDAEHLPAILPQLSPTAILLNPPFSRSPARSTRRLGTDARHLKAAYRMLRPGGRLVALTSLACDPHENTWLHALPPDPDTEPPPRLLATWSLSPKLFHGRGVQIPTRLTVLERPRERSPHRVPGHPHPVSTLDELLTRIHDTLPPRLVPAAVKPATQQHARTSRPARPRPRSPTRSRRTAPLPTVTWQNVTPLKHHPSPASPSTPSDDRPAIYTPWRPRTFTVPGAHAHPNRLVETNAMHTVRHPASDYRPLLPRHLIDGGILSDAQLETLILAGAAFERRLDQAVRTDTDYEELTDFDDTLPDPDDPHAVRPRRGFFLGDGTGAGKGRQVAGIILDQWLRGHRRALWLSMSDDLIADARRDWTALGGDARQIIRLRDFHANDEIPHAEAIVFCTYATLRTPARPTRRSRLRQIVDWLGRTDRASYEGVIAADEAHALCNAAPTATERGTTPPSQQGLAAMRLQRALPNAKILYSSATGASTLRGLAYAARLGLWASPDTEFATRDEFIDALSRGGVSSMEVIARDLKALGLYQARYLSYDGVETEILVHELTPAEIELYDSYADAFALIHKHLRAALQDTGVLDEDQHAVDKAAYGAALSTFESTKQRFFNHLLCGLKCPTMLQSIESDLRVDRAPVIQLVSTGEALMRRRLHQIPPSEWNDLHIDLTPRDSVLEYLERAFPIHLVEEYTDPDGGTHTRPVYDEEGHPVADPAALERRDALLLHLAALPPVPTALDQVLHHFGHQRVAEVTGRSQRIVRITDEPIERYALQSRPATASKIETEDFMSGDRDVLVFSMAGGTGRSYHASLDHLNQNRRAHYLAEPGWNPKTAIQGLGRSNRCHQASAPLFRPVTTNVRAEARFTSTIARRLDSLGAITRGERHAQTRVDERTALFREEDNLESPYAKTALSLFYMDLSLKRIPGWSVKRFEDATGLSLATRQGSTRLEHPKMSTTLNRLLALRIADQNTLFEALQTRIESVIADAKADNTYDTGLELITAASIRIAERHTLYQHQTTKSLTELITLDLVHERRPFAQHLLRRLLAHKHALRIRNTRSQRAAIRLPYPSRRRKDGSYEERFLLYHPFKEGLNNQDFGGCSSPLART